MTEGSIFRQLALSGETIKDELVIDCHSHIGGYSSIYHLPDSDIASVVHEMDRIGVDRAITFSFAGINSDYVLGNDDVIDAVKRYPDRFRGLAIVNPHYEFEMVEELERCRKLGLTGIKMIAGYQRYDPQGPAYIPAFEYADAHGWPILNHDWGSPEYLDKLAQTYKNAVFICGHYFGFGGHNLKYADILKKHENVLQCTCAALNHGDIEALVKAVPLEKIVFGSDFCDLPIPFSVGPILFARIPDDAKRRILGLNAAERFWGK